MATRQVRDRRALDTLLNDDWNEQNHLDRSLVNRPRSFHDEALARLDRRQKPAKPEWEQGIPLPGREPPQQHQQQQESRRNTPEQLTAQTILNPATSKDVTVHFHMDVAGDIGVLLEESSRLKRLGGFQAAAHYFDENLRDFADVLPVVIEYADMLVEQGAYQRLKDFLRQHNQVLQRSTKIVRLITDEERETLVYQASLQLIDVFASMHLTGNMDTTYDMVREVTKTARAILNSRSRVLEPLDSAEVQIFRYAHKVLSRIEKETDSVPESDFDYWANCNHLYRPLIATGQVWDARDLLCDLIDSEGASNTWRIIFRTAIKSSDAFTKLLGDWNMGQYDESTYLAILDILVHASNQLSSLIVASPSSEDISLAARCLDHARDVATCLKENNPELVHSRSYLSWILAETQLRRKHNPAPSDLDAAVETARGREDYATEVACLAELIYRASGGPRAQEQRFFRMYDLQLRHQGDILNSQQTCPARFLTRTNDHGHRALLADINELHRYTPNEFPSTLTLTSWCMRVIERSLQSQAAGAVTRTTADNNVWSPTPDLPQYIKDELTARDLGRSYGLDLDEMDTYWRRRTPHRSRSSDRGTLYGPNHPPAPTRRNGSYERERPTTDRFPPLSPKVVPSNRIVNPARRIPDPFAYPGSDSDSGNEGPSDALVNRARGAVVYNPPDDSDYAESVEEPGKQEKREDAENAGDSNREMKPPVRQNTVEIADESEVEEAGEA